MQFPTKNLSNLLFCKILNKFSYCDKYRLTEVGKSEFLKKKEKIKVIILKNFKKCRYFDKYSLFYVAQCNFQQKICQIYFFAKFQINLAILINIDK